MSEPVQALRQALQTALAQPWFTPYAPLARGLAESLDAGLGLLPALDAALDGVHARCPPITLRAGRLRFVEAGALPPGEAYEAFIARTACVPTRSNVHDLFNALVWLRFPELKARLNELQAQQIAQHGVGPSRGPLRDALTLFDENGALWAAPAALAQALAGRRWSKLFVTHRDEWHGVPPLLFGHALLEKLLAPRKALTAHVWLLPPAAQVADAEQAALGLLPPHGLGVPAHLPLPVLGVPGWWPANESPGFYDDAAVFRPPRR